MGSPREALPLGITISTIHQLLPTINVRPASSISILSTSAEYHIIALLAYSAPNSDLILRIAGSHVTKLKTENEVAVISWLQRNTTIPVPKVVHFDSSTNNPLGCEYIIQERVEGESLDKVWPALNESERDLVWDFVADVLKQLNVHKFDFIGSIQLSSDEPGPVLDERYWEERDIEKHFPGETYESMNPLGPYRTYVEYSIARLEKAMHAIRIHPSLEFMRPHLPLITSFTQALQANAASLNANSKNILAHRDLHMGNIMYSPSQKRVTGILDWEFSVVMPLQQGDFSRALMWPEPKERVPREMRKRGVHVDEAQRRTADMQEVVDLIRAIVEVSPRGQRHEEKVVWMRRAVEIMKGFITKH